MRPLDERLKFGNGLTIGTHAVTLTKSGKSLPALVTIPSRGAPRIQVIGPRYLSTYRVVGDDLQLKGSACADVYRAQFSEATANPVATIET